MQVQLSKYDNSDFQRGRNKFIEFLWLFIQFLFVSSWVPGAFHRRILLRMFGARIGKGVDIKPGVKVKFPWRLSVEDYCWIGEDVWIDNLAPVVIETNSCLSQGAYLCTGSHDWSAETFNLITKPIKLGQSCWICARSVVGPGVTVGEGAILSLGSAATCDLKPWTIYKGSPCVEHGKRNPQKTLAA